MLYQAVTKYVSEEFNRADKLDPDRRGTVGFAMTILQRRLASSPEAIYQSLRRRRERLESRLREERVLKRGGEVRSDFMQDLPKLDIEEVEDFEDAPEEEQEQNSEQLIDLATASRTIHELELEIAELRRLEQMADRVRRSGNDRKWQELSRILQENEQMFDGNGQRRKLVIFTEHRDTLNYLVDRISTLLGKPEAVVAIHGGLSRDERRTIQASFIQDKDVFILVATDAAGEGINLQRAHLMVNYDLPWNPARIEQRFGRIHRIGQTEVCHLWNLVADETREGDVYTRLLNKIEEQRRALGDGVFDILGKLFRETSLRDLLMEAIRYGDRPEVRDRLNQAVDNIVDRKHCQDLLEDSGQAHSIPVDLSLIFMRFHIPTPIQKPLPGQQGLLVDAKNGIVVINSNDPPSRQKFSQAHELVEFLFNSLPNGKNIGNGWTLKKPGGFTESMKEYLCNRTAASLLMPPAYVHSQITQYGANFDCARLISEECKISLSAALVQTARISQGNHSVVLWMMKNKPSEIKGEIPAAQLGFFNDPISHPTMKLRVEWSLGSESAPFIPKDKSVEETSLVFKAWQTGSFTSGEECLCLDGRKSRWFRTENLPFNVDGGTQVLSLIEYR